MALEHIQGPVSKPLATQNNTRALLATCFSITHPPSPLGVCIRVTEKKRPKKENERPPTNRNKDRFQKQRDRCHRQKRSDGVRAMESIDPVTKLGFAAKEPAGSATTRPGLCLSCANITTVEDRQLIHGRLSKTRQLADTQV